MATAAPTPKLNPALFPGLIQHHPKHRLLCCRPCFAAVLPKALCRHLQTFHQVPIEQRRLLLKHCESLDLITQAKDIQLPPNHSPALQFLPVTKGYSCRQPQCPYLTSNEDNMRWHINKTHKLFVQACTDSFQSVQLQSWFHDSRAKYWIVMVEAAVTPTIQHQKGSGLSSNTIPLGLRRNPVFWYGGWPVRTPTGLRRNPVEKGRDSSRF